MLLPFHAHFDFPVPGAALVDLLPGVDDTDCHFDLVVADRNDDDNLEIEAKWDLPGTALDSGPEPRKVVLPTALIKDSVEDAVALLFQTVGVPVPVTKAIEAGLGGVIGLILKGLVALAD